MKSLILSLCFIIIATSLCIAEDKSKIFVFEKSKSSYVFTNIVPISVSRLKLVKVIKITHRKKVKHLKNRKEKVDSILKQVAKEHHIDYRLLKAVAVVESGMNPTVRSNKGATGVMQLMPVTAKRFGVRNLNDVKENIKGGARYLKYLLKKFNYNYQLTLAAYNAGENAVLRYKSIPPYRETKNYVKKVFLRYKRYLSNEKFF